MHPLQNENGGKQKKSGWWRSAEGLVVAVGFAIRGCWHRRLSWPVAEGGYSYQVCLNCGAKRLWDEKSFSPRGPFRYELSELIPPEKSSEPESHPRKSSLENLPHPAP